MRCRGSLRLLVPVLALAATGSCATKNIKSGASPTGTNRTEKQIGAARMKAEQEIQRLRSGEPFQGDISAFTAPDAQAIELLADELRNNPAPKIREQVAKALAKLGREGDPDKLLAHRRILSSLLDDGGIKADCAYMWAMNEIAASTPAQDLQEFEPTLVRLASKAPVSGLFLVIAKAKAREALPVLRKRSGEPEWKEDLSLRIALAALGDQDLENRFIEEFETTTDADAKMRSAETLGRIGTRKALEALARGMRSPLVATIPATFMKSVRPDIAKAIHMNYPRHRFLLIIRSDADYERIEQFCEKEFGTTWKAPRPPFLTIQPLAPTP